MKGRGAILVIEDEGMVLDATRTMLERLGYRVLTAKTGAEGVQIVQTTGLSIDLALLDLKLPDMQGAIVYPLLMKARPDLKVIVFSGYEVQGPVQEILDAGAQGVVQKPFSLTSLVNKVKEVLPPLQIGNIFRQHRPSVDATHSSRDRYSRNSKAWFRR